MAWDFTVDSDIQLEMANVLKGKADELDTQFANLYTQIGPGNLGTHWVGSDYDAFNVGCEGYKQALADMTDSIRMYANHFEKVAEGTDLLAADCIAIVQNMTTRGDALPGSGNAQNPNGTGTGTGNGTGTGTGTGGNGTGTGTGNGTGTGTGTGGNGGSGTGTGNGTGTGSGGNGIGTPYIPGATVAGGGNGTGTGGNGTGTGGTGTGGAYGTGTGGTTGTGGYHGIGTGGNGTGTGTGGSNNTGGNSSAGWAAAGAAAGALVGGIPGAIVGGIAGNAIGKSGNGTKGAAVGAGIGAVVGGLPGAMIGGFIGQSVGKGGSEAKWTAGGAAAGLLLGGVPGAVTGAIAGKAINGYKTGEFKTAFQNNPIYKEMGEDFSNNFDYSNCDGLLDGAVTTATGLVKTAGDTIEYGTNIVHDTIDTGIDAIQYSVLDRDKDYWSNRGEDFTENFDYSNCDGVLDGAVTTVTGVARTAWDVGETAVNGVVDGVQWIGDRAQDLVDWIF